MRTTAGILSLAIALAALPALGQPDRAELLKSPRYAAKDRQPLFKTLSAEEVRSAIRVTSSRNSALFGFNDSAVEIHRRASTTATGSRRSSVSRSCSTSGGGR